jgi:hypothetical protein
MKQTSRWLKLTVIPMAALMLVPLRGEAQDSAASLPAYLKDRPIDEGVLLDIERQPVSRETLPGLATAFSQGGSKHDLQLIAATIIRLGDKSERYYNYLAEFAHEAIKDRTPFFVSYDNQGHAIRGKLDPGFENWCALNGKAPMAIVAAQMGEQPGDVLTLARVNDIRSRDLLRSGLESPNPLVVAYSVQGLGRIQDWDAIPLIEKASQRLNPGEHLTLAMQLPWFTGPQEDRLMRELLPDSHARDFFTRQVRGWQFAESEAAQRRSGVLSPK